MRHVLEAFIAIILFAQVSWAGDNSSVFRESHPTENFEIYKITKSRFLREAIRELFEISNSAVICPLIANLDSPIDSIRGRDTQSLCKGKFATVKPLLETFAGRGGLHEFYLVFGGNFPFKSWTDVNLNTYIFVESHSNREDLLRSLAHELNIVYDLKYDATMWGFNFGVRPPLSPILHHFFSLWLRSPVIRIGLSVIRSEVVEEMVFSKRWEGIGADKCYDILEHLLIKQNNYYALYETTAHKHSSVSFSSELGSHLEDQGLGVNNEPVTDEDITFWIKHLSTLDKTSQFCQFLTEPVPGQSLNFMAAGPRPRIGGGLSIAKENKLMTPEAVPVDLSAVIKQQINDLPNEREIKSWKELDRLKSHYEQKRIFKNLSRESK